MSSKRAAVTTDDTPAPKQPRVGEYTPSTSSARPHGRVVLDVGGTRFVSSRTTLESTSSYFSSLLARWDEHSDEPLFIDSDADAFRELLSYMRSGTLMLPPDDERLCARVLLQAEYLGMDALLDEVKAQAFTNMHPDTHQDEERPLARAFDEDVGSLAVAIRSKVLPARYFAPPPKPTPPPPERTIKALLPAAPGYRALFTDEYFDMGSAREMDDMESEAYCESLHIVSWALVEYRDGTQCVDAVVQRDLDDTHRSAAIECAYRDEKTHSHMLLASEYKGCERDNFSDEAKHWVIVPPRAPGQMLPIPPGSVRGLWAKPALTKADVGKNITISGNIITVDGDRRKVIWDGDAPEGVSGKRIEAIYDWNSYHAGCSIAGDAKRIAVPRMANAEEMEIDLAFASVQGDGAGDLKTEFYMPLFTNGTHKDATTKLAGATTVNFGGHMFSHFLGAKRS